MKVRYEKDGTVFEFERRPMPEHRFRTLCLLAAAGMYGGMMCAVAALCGVWGVAMMAVATLFTAMIADS